eukprot:scaffold17546_cov69-Phaeocystis_antarctica.AAC.4
MFSSASCARSRVGASTAWVCSISSCGLTRSPIISTHRASSLKLRMSAAAKRTTPSSSMARHAQRAASNPSQPASSCFVSPQRGSTAWLQRLERTKRRRRSSCSLSSMQPTSSPAQQLDATDCTRSAAQRRTLLIRLCPVQELAERVKRRQLMTPADFVAAAQCSERLGDGGGVHGHRPSASSAQRSRPGLYRNRN